MKLVLPMLLVLLSSACVVVPTESYGGKAGGGSQDAAGSTLVCHKGKKTLQLPPDAVPAHMNHGDSRGPC